MLSELIKLVPLGRFVCSAGKGAGEGGDITSAAATEDPAEGLHMGSGTASTDDASGSSGTACSAADAAAAL